MNMPHKTRTTVPLLALVAALVFGGCASVGSNVKRAGAVALGAGMGGGAGYLIDPDDPMKTVLGAVAGAGLAQLAMGEDAETRQDGFDQGYVQGQSDAIKRQYFLRHAKEAEPLKECDQGETVYYVMPGPETTVDGRKLSPHRVAVRVVE